MIDTQTSADVKSPAPFGTRLKTARESLGLDRKDVANQLRLNEKIILMMEKDRYPSDLPVTFIRGYLRAYGKFLQIPEYEIKKAIEPIKPKTTLGEPIIPIQKQSVMVTSGNYFMQLLTYLIVITLVALVGIWWYTHKPFPNFHLENFIPTANKIGAMKPDTKSDTLAPSAATEAKPLEASAKDSNHPQIGNKTIEEDGDRDAYADINED